jgi:hypothetical protein
MPDSNFEFRWSRTMSFTTKHLFTTMLLLAGTLFTVATTAQSPTPFDGNWDVVLNCPPHDAEDDDAKGYTHRFSGKIDGGELSATYGTAGEAGWHHLHGPIMADGKAALRLDGIVSRPEYAINKATKGKPYTYRVRAMFESAKGTGQRVGRRQCSFTFTKR